MGGGQSRLAKVGLGRPSFFKLKCCAYSSVSSLRLSNFDFDTESFTLNAVMIFESGCPPIFNADLPLAVSAYRELFESIGRKNSYIGKVVKKSEPCPFIGDKKLIRLKYK